MEFQAYLVGGAVRDALLGVDVYDRDWVVVGSTPQAMLDAGYEQVGKDFPVFLHPKTKEEYALARTERKAGVGYHGFEVSASPEVSLEEDLLRRDLTINAMAQNDSGDIVDPYGGLEDLKNRVLRHVSPAFSEDPLRVLRVARFAAKLNRFGFKLHEDTRLLMSRMAASGELESLTPERVWQEVVKALGCDKPSVFFTVLREVGALKVLFPELDCLYEVAQPPQYHPEGDVGTHTMMVLDAAAELSESLDVRFAALVHDLGKGVTPKELWPKHHGHEAAGVPIVAKLCQRYRVPKKIQQLSEKVTEWHGLVHKGLDSDGRPALKPKTYLKVVQACSFFKNPEILQLVLLACEADARGRTGFENAVYPQAEFWMALANAANKVNNREIIEQGFQGAEIAEAIERKRLQLISDFLKSY
ncbi:multifunctional CCA addition/repair protein [Thiomicrorhabdus sp. ZW0627]|uniref:multifunctional CCA addition/repair protein n=1 Tax=Thiomicrorhabdus sp. ZW0627 TaxID=3039774 RepID=UPI00243663B6|nr:multifunctional CCA addition/repair protein [Thiomicrorhabdus sp. ZW0627]MDG6774441.1 multifunctional CCA addition/repair protein [Thiomicrorhabdus sp. ZW0627]